MLAIYKKEFKSYFISMIGYIFVAFLLFIIGIFFRAINLKMAHSLIGSALGNISIIFVLIVPILTMKVLADERRLKTDQLLLTAPVKISQIVMGKFFAMLSVFAVPMVIICLYPFILDLYGDVSIGMSFTAIFGFLLLGGAYLSVGLFISSLTESQVIAAVISFGAFLLSYLMTSITTLIPTVAIVSMVSVSAILLAFCIVFWLMTKNVAVPVAIGIVGEIVIVLIYILKVTLFEGLIEKVLLVLSLNDKYSNFQGGIFDVTSVLYYLSVIGFFLFLTNQSIQKRRWS